MALRLSRALARVPDWVQAEARSVVINGWAIDPLVIRVRVRSGFPKIVVGGDGKGSHAMAGRLRQAISAVGLAVPTARIVIELVPNTAPRSYHDLPVLLAVLAALDLTDREQLSDWIVAGGLDGTGALLAPPNPLAIALHARAHDLGLLTAASA